MNTNFIYTLLMAALLTATHCAKAQKVIFQPSDSVKIEQLLQEGLQQPKGTCLPLFYGRHFIGLPYVAQTLEVNYIENPQEATEQLIINTRELDCTTFVETVCALVRTTCQGKATFTDYCRNIKQMRYQGGKLDGYASRCHYYSTWIDNAEALGIAHELGPDDSPYFTATKNQVINFMTTHPDYYPALRAPKGKQFMPDIRKAEQSITRPQRYIPISALGKNRTQLSCIHDGDIVALVTDKAGLDVAHLGLAMWGKDGKLHFMHASSLRHKVVEEPLTLQQYQQKQKTQRGIRVIRIL
ncbi:MAG: DUF1460 domain-containing protein [Bacteroidaceae bacterium]|nr:DUF1460 domain-containing protein [Bacteroidaceae bacterium]